MICTYSLGTEDYEIDPISPPLLGRHSLPCDFSALPMEGQSLFPHPLI